MSDDQVSAEAPSAPPFPVYCVGMDAAGVVISHLQSNAAQPDMTVVDGATWAKMADLGWRCTFDGESVGAYTPPPPTPPPRRAPLPKLLDQLSPAQRGAITRDHMDRLQADAGAMPDGTVFVGSSKVARAAGDLGMTPDAWFTLAGA